MSVTTPGLLHVPTALPPVDENRKLHPVWKQLFNNIAGLLNQGVPSPQNAFGVQIPQSITITLVKLTGPGANGSLTFTNGILTAFQAPT